MRGKIFIIALGTMFFGFNVYAKNFSKDLSEIRQLSLSQLKANAEKFSQTNNSLYNEVLSMARSSKENGDLTRLNCIKSILPAMKGLLRISQQALINLKESVATGERTDAEHQYVKIYISKQKMEELYAQAQQCGQAQIKQIFEKGVNVEKRVSKNVPKQDITTILLTEIPSPEEKDEGTAAPDKFVFTTVGNEIPGTGFY